MENSIKSFYKQDTAQFYSILDHYFIGRWKLNKERVSVLFIGPGIGEILAIKKMLEEKYGMKREEFDLLGIEISEEIAREGVAGGGDTTTKVEKFNELLDLYIYGEKGDARNEETFKKIMEIKKLEGFDLIVFYRPYLGIRGFEDTEKILENAHKYLTKDGCIISVNAWTGESKLLESIIKNLKLPFHFSDYIKMPFTSERVYLFIGKK